jgi:hypothetical protein
MWILLFLVFGTKFTGISQKSRWHSNPCHNQIDKVCNEILFVLSICESISKNVTMWIIINNNKRTPDTSVTYKGWSMESNYINYVV